MNSASRVFRLWLTLLAFLAVDGLAGQAADHSWPQWRGPHRDAVSRETGLLKTWPEGGPARLWTATGCGLGYSSMAVSDGLIYTAGTSSGETFVVAFDLDGKEKWRTTNGQPWAAAPKMTWATSYNGSRATPTVNDGRVYHLNETGLLSAFDASNGKPAWSLNILREFGAVCPDYGYSESVLIDGDHLICYPGGTNGFMAALDKKTGARVWVNRDIGDVAGFSSAILAEDRGSRQIITLTEQFVIGVDADAGKLLWRHPFVNKRQNNIPTPIYDKGSVWASTGYGTGSIRLALTVEGGNVAVRQIWASPELDNVHGGIVKVDGFIYGASHNKPAWFCLDAKDGQPRFKDAGVGMGSVVYADNRLYCLGERGAMALVVCQPDRYEEAGRFEVPKGGPGLYWAHPVVCDGRLYVRHADQLHAYDIRGTAAAR